MEEVKAPKKVVLYARVSSDLQKLERTIESQIAELKSKILKAGDILVKEYVDDGYSGAELHRPAMDQLRRDLRSGLFDAVHFLSTDRIARDVTYQTIIVGEILKHKKQLIINGKDYVQNPENKFMLTILGAVAELERAKNIERMSRGRAYKLAHGFHVGSGSKTYGYDYIYKTSEHHSGFKINEHEATAVRYVFEEYSKGSVSAYDIARKLGEMGYITKRGSSRWDGTSVISILENHGYTGTMYMNREKVVKENVTTPEGGQRTVRKLIYVISQNGLASLCPLLSQKNSTRKCKKELHGTKKILGVLINLGFSLT